MLLSSTLITGTALVVGVRAYRKNKKKKETPWTYYTERIRKNKKNSILKIKPVGNRLFRPPQIEKFTADKDKLNVLCAVPEDKPAIAYQALSRQKTAEEQKSDQRVVLSITTLGIALASPFVALPLELVAAGSLIYMLIPVIGDWTTKLVKEQKLDPNMLWTIGALGLIATHHVVLSASCAILYHMGRKLVLRTEDNSRNTLVNIMGEEPASVWVFRDGVEIEIQFQMLETDDVIIVLAGQMIPIDGEIIQGDASIDQQRLTGEAQPVEKTVGDTVLAATVVLSGQIQIRVQQTGDQTVAAQIGNVLNNTIDYRTTTLLRFQTVFERMTGPVIGLAGAATILFGPAGGVAILCNMPATAIGFISSLNVLTYLNKTSQLGVLVKDGRALEMLKATDTIVFDKTGTLTLEQPTVGTIHVCGKFSKADLLRYVASAEIKQSHPIAKALCQAAADQQLDLYSIEASQYELGYGISTQINGHHVRVGSQRFMKKCDISVPSDIITHQDKCDANGISLVYVAIDEQLDGVIELYPTIRPEAQEIVTALQKRGLTLIIISGDREQPTQRLAAQLGINHYFAEVLPQDKGNLIDQLQAEGHRVCFIGDGINDTIALKKAKTSISFSGATSAATDTAQMVLMDGNLTPLPQLFELSEQFNANTNRTLYALLTPVGVSMFGVFFLHTGILFAGAAYYVALSGAIASALLPAWRQAD